MFFRTCVVGWELGKEGGGDRATVPQKSASPGHCLCTPIAMELGRVISFHCHGRNVSFSWIFEKKACGFLGAPGRVEGTEEFLNDLFHVEERVSHWERAVASPGGHPWPEWAQRFSWGRSMRSQFPGRDWVGQRNHKVHARKTIKKEWSPRFLLPQFPFLKDRKSPKKTELSAMK